MGKVRKSGRKFKLERWTITTIKNTCDYENGKQTIMKNVLILPQNWELLQLKEANGTIKKVVFVVTNRGGNKQIFFSLTKLLL